MNSGKYDHPNFFFGIRTRDIEAAIIKLDVKAEILFIYLIGLCRLWSALQIIGLFICIWQSAVKQKSIYNQRNAFLAFLFVVSLKVKDQKTVFTFHARAGIKKKIADRLLINWSSI